MVVGVRPKGAELSRTELGTFGYQVADGNQFYRRVLKAGQNALEGVLAAADKAGAYAARILMAKGHLAVTYVVANVV
jgi:hypothetical protein